MEQGAGVTDGGTRPEATSRVCLVVDDSAVVRGLLVRALASVPALRVVEATDGADALRRLEGGRYDLVVTDLQMPLVGGLELVERVRAGGSHRGVPVVVLTTESGEDVRGRALEAGASAFLTKPVEPFELVAVVRALLPGW